MQTYRKTR